MKAISLTKPDLTQPRAKFLPVPNSTVSHHIRPTYPSYQHLSEHPLLFLHCLTSRTITPSNTTAKPLIAKNLASPVALPQSPPSTPLTEKEWTNAFDRNPPRTFPTSAGSAGLFPVIFLSIHSPGHTPYTKNRRAKRRCQPYDQNFRTDVISHTLVLYSGGKNARGLGASGESMMANRECPKEKADIRKAPSAAVKASCMGNGSSSSNSSQDLLPSTSEGRSADCTM